jgi:exonuclease SbcC
VQAIRTIQDDFEKILVITHIDELKVEFGARIDVVKSARGSQAVVN